MSEVIHAAAWASSSSLASMDASTVSIEVVREATSSSCMKRRYSASFSGSSGKAVGKSRRTRGSSGGAVISSRSCGRRWRSEVALLGRELDAVGAGPGPLHPPAPQHRPSRRSPSLIVLHRGPQPVLVEAEDVELGLLPRPVRHHRPTLVVHVEHEVGGLLLRVPEQLLEHEHDVGHEVDRVVPHDDDPCDADEARAALDRVGLADRAHHRPSELSGGEQQRVCVARALVNQPKLLLADEPTGNLDEANESKVLALFEELHAEGHTVVTVTHALRVGLLADRRIELSHGRLADLTVPSQEIERRYDEVLIQLWLADERRAPLAPERVQLPDVVDTRRTLKGMHESGLLASPTAPLGFTPRGRSRARDLIRRRRLAEVLFSSALHLPEDEVEQTACLMEHVIDPTVANSICAFLGHPRRCPHGRPIPVRGLLRAPDRSRLTATAPGGSIDARCPLAASSARCSSPR